MCEEKYKNKPDFKIQKELAKKHIESKKKQGSKKIPTVGEVIKQHYDNTEPTVDRLKKELGES